MKRKVLAGAVILVGFLTLVYVVRSCSPPREPVIRKDLVAQKEPLPEREYRPPLVGKGKPPVPQEVLPMEPVKASLHIEVPNVPEPVVVLEGESGKFYQVSGPGTVRVWRWERPSVEFPFHFVLSEGFNGSPFVSLGVDFLRVRRLRLGVDALVTWRGEVDGAGVIRCEIGQGRLFGENVRVVLSAGYGFATKRPLVSVGFTW